MSDDPIFVEIDARLGEPYAAGRAVLEGVRFLVFGVALVAEVPAGGGEKLCRALVVCAQNHRFHALSLARHVLDIAGHASRHLLHGPGGS